MKLIRVVVAVAGLLFVNGVLAPTSSAITAVVCQGLLANLRSDTYASRSSFTNQADYNDNYTRVNIVWPRITGALAAPDTLLILTDYQTSLNALAAASPPKLDPAVAQRLVDGAQDVINCVAANNPVPLEV